MGSPPALVDYPSLVERMEGVDKAYYFQQLANCFHCKYPNCKTPNPFARVSPNMEDLFECCHMFCIECQLQMVKDKVTQCPQCHVLGDPSNGLPCKGAIKNIMQAMKPNFDDESGKFKRSEDEILYDNSVMHACDQYAKQINYRCDFDLQGTQCDEHLVKWLIQNQSEELKTILKVAQQNRIKMAIQKKQKQYDSLKFELRTLLKQLQKKQDPAVRSKVSEIVEKMAFLKPSFGDCVRNTLGVVECESDDESDEEYEQIDAHEHTNDLPEVNLPEHPELTDDSQIRADENIIQAEYPAVRSFTPPNFELESGVANMNLANHIQSPTKQNDTESLKHQDPAPAKTPSKKARKKRSQTPVSPGGTTYMECFTESEKRQQYVCNICEMQIHRLKCVYHIIDCHVELRGKYKNSFTPKPSEYMRKLLDREAQDFENKFSMENCKVDDENEHQKMDEFDEEIGSNHSGENRELVAGHENEGTIVETQGNEGTIVETQGNEGTIIETQGNEVVNEVEEEMSESSVEIGCAQYVNHSQESVMATAGSPIKQETQQQMVDEVNEPTEVDENVAKEMVVKSKANPSIGKGNSGRRSSPRARRSLESESGKGEKLSAIEKNTSENAKETAEKKTPPRTALKRNVEATQMNSSEARSKRSRSAPRETTPISTPIAKGSLESESGKGEKLTAIEKNTSKIATEIPEKKTPPRTAIKRNVEATQMNSSEARSKRSRSAPRETTPISTPIAKAVKVVKPTPKRKSRSATPSKDRKRESVSTPKLTPVNKLPPPRFIYTRGTNVEDLKYYLREWQVNPNILYKCVPPLDVQKSMTPLHFACEGLDIDAVRILLEHGADANCRTLPMLETPLTLLMQDSVKQITINSHPAYVRWETIGKILLEYGGRLDLANGFGQTATQLLALNFGCQPLEEGVNFTRNEVVPKYDDKLETARRCYMGTLLLVNLSEEHMKMVEKLRNEVEDFAKFEIITHGANENVTHVVVPENSLKLADRTEDIFLSVARGAFIVTTDWIKECLQKKSVVAARAFEVYGIRVMVTNKGKRTCEATYLGGNCLGAIGRIRLVPPILSGCVIRLVGKPSVVYYSLDVMKKAIALAGAVEYQAARTPQLTPFHADQNEALKQGKYLVVCNPDEVPCVAKGVIVCSYAWLHDVIMRCSLITPF